jgi:hypothetical protein
MNKVFIAISCFLVVGCANMGEFRDGLATTLSAVGGYYSGQAQTYQQQQTYHYDPNYEYIPYQTPVTKVTVQPIINGNGQALGYQMLAK